MDEIRKWIGIAKRQGVEEGFEAAREQAAKRCEAEHDSQQAFAANLTQYNRAFAEERALMAARCADAIRAMKEGE